MCTDYIFITFSKSILFRLSSKIFIDLKQKYQKSVAAVDLLLFEKFNNSKQS